MASEALYRETVIYLATTARLLASMPLDKLIVAIERAAVTGPFLDPTLYRDKGRAMCEDLELLKAVVPLRDLGLVLNVATRRAKKKVNGDE